jgi:hypothetical protein
MNRPPPEADTEYSRGGQASRGRPEGPESPRRRADSPPATAAGRPVGGPLALAAGLGALLLVVAEFTALFDVKVTTFSAPIRTVSAGSHNSYALIPVALLAAALALAVWRAGSRPALLALGLLGVIALSIALLGDLPDTHSSGLVLRSGRYVSGVAHPELGLYLEVLGAVVLLGSCVCGFLLIGMPVSRRGTSRKSS